MACTTGCAYAAVVPSPQPIFLCDIACICRASSTAAHELYAYEMRDTWFQGPDDPPPRIPRDLRFPRAPDFHVSLGRTLYAINTKPTQLGAQLKHQFGPALAAADAMIRQQQEQSSTAATSGGSDSPAAKAKMAHMNPKRTGVLLDFGTGTSFASFAELWEYLRHNGWATLRGKGLASWYYFPPGCDPKMPHPVLRRDYFDSEDAVIDHVRRTGLERPAPVGTAVSFGREDWVRLGRCCWTWMCLAVFCRRRMMQWALLRLFVGSCLCLGSVDLLSCLVLGDGWVWVVHHVVFGLG